MEIKDDGTQTLTFKIPKYFIGEVPNTRITNPRWKDVETGVLAENTRVLKVFVQFKDTIKVFPFMIDKIVNKRDNNFSVYKEVTGNGLAFAELGKIGYKLELSSEVLETDFKNDDTVVANINYWLDKVFPNVRDDAGNVLRWLTPWSYEIRMDWRGYFQDPSDFLIQGGDAVNWQDKGFMFYNSKGMAVTRNNKDKNWLNIVGGTSAKQYQIRDEEVIYEDAYVADWMVNSDNSLAPIKVNSYEEKARYVDCQNSNKYNITQAIAEAFGVFCVYEYEVDQHGYFKGTYWDDIGRIWTGKRVVFYNRAIKTDNPFTINYQHNLSTISRTIDSSEIYTKLYVVPLESEVQESGFVTIAETASNPLLDDFILNFDYMKQVGSITEEQYEWIEKTYKVDLHRLNKSLIDKQSEFNTLQNSLNEAEAELATAKNELLAAQDELTEYQRLRDNDTFKTPVVKDETNPYSAIFVPQSNTGINLATFRLTGIDVSAATGIECYNNKDYVDEGKTTITSEYDIPKKCVFSTVNSAYPTPIFVKDCPGQATAEANKDKWFIMTDEDGFPTSVYTSLEHIQDGANGTFTKNFSTGGIYYFRVTHCPQNKYKAVCQRFEAEVKTKENLIEVLERKINNLPSDDYPELGLKQQLDSRQQEIDELLEEKEDLNYRFERLLGPAVREGYWQAENYEDPGQGFNVTISVEAPNPEPNTFFIFDTEPFDGETESHYLIAPDGETTTEYTNKYYPYIDLSSIYSKDNTIMDNIDEFVINLEHPQFVADITEASFPAGNYQFTYNSVTYYFKLATALEKNSKLYLTILEEIQPTTGQRKVDLTYTTPGSTTQTSSGITWCESSAADVWIEISSRFEGLNHFLGVRSLYNTKGFELCWLDISTEEEKEEGGQKVKPVALLTNTDINYELYSKVTYAPNSAANPIGGLSITSNATTKYPIAYPRIKIDYKNVNHASDNLTLRCSARDAVDENGEIIVADNLERYVDYKILLRDGKPYISLKITNDNPMRFIGFYEYNLIYQVSRANEMLYLDAKQVAKDNSKPKYSYEVEIGNIPDDINQVELGQLCYVCDHTVDAARERGYISEITYQLDAPQKDTFVIANYKTKFEDLFSSLAAQNEAMKQNQTSYAIAAQSFNSNGEITQDTLQKTLDNTDAQFTFGQNSITLDKEGGMIVTNESSYRNGVYGQIKIAAGGLYCSDSVDSDGTRLWTTGITPKGINASLITTGQLDTKHINILSGDQTRFQWNETGLFAYCNDNSAKTDDGRFVIDTSTFVKLNEEGLKFTKDNVELLSLDWEGMRIGAQGGAVQITSDNGIEVYNQSNKRLVQLGRHSINSNDANSLYGLAMYNTSGSKTLYTDQNGNLHLTGKLSVGSGEGYVCINGAASSNTDYVLYAGNESPSQAEFALRKDGKIFSKGVEVTLTPVSSTTT